MNNLSTKLECAGFVTLTRKINFKVKVLLGINWNVLDKGRKSG